MKFDVAYRHRTGDLQLLQFQRVLKRFFGLGVAQGTVNQLVEQVGYAKRFDDDLLPLKIDDFEFVACIMDQLIRAFEIAFDIEQKIFTVVELFV